MDRAIITMLYIEIWEHSQCMARRGLIILQRIERYDTFAEQPRWRDGLLVLPGLDHTNSHIASGPGRPGPMPALPAQMRLRLIMMHLVRRRHSNTTGSLMHLTHLISTVQDIPRSAYTEYRERGTRRDHEARGSVIVCEICLVSRQGSLALATSLVLTRVSANLSSAGPKPSVRTVILAQPPP